MKGGPFTRSDPATGRLSCLDFWLCTTGLVPHVKCLEIDSERKMAVARPVRRGGRWQLTHSDHFSMLLTLENLPKVRQREKMEKEVRWNLSKKNGWEKYKQLTEANSDKITSLVQDEELDIERVMAKIEGIENKIKFKAFGKTSCKMKAVEKQKENRKENPSAGPKCPVGGLAEASLLPSGPAEGPMEENEVVQQRMLINDPTAGAGPKCPVRGLAEASLSPSGPAQGPLGESDVAKDLI